MKNFLPLAILCMVFSVPVVSFSQEPASCAFNYGTYTDLKPKPIYSDSPVCGLIGGKFYLTGGIDYGDDINVSLKDLMQIYDPETDSWDTTGARIPVPRTFYGSSDMALEGKLYAVGGADWVYTGGEWYPVPYARVDVYDPQSDTWELKANLPVPIGINGACTLNGKIYVSGGISTDQTPLNTLFCYDPGTDQWSELSAMETARAAHTSIALDGKIYVIAGGAGENFPNSVTRTCEVYDPDLDQWTYIASYPRANAFGAACVIDGEIYVFGGSGVPTSDPYVYAYKYHPETDTWIQIDYMKTQSKGHFVAAVGRTIYLFGVDMYDNLFTQTYTLSSVRLDSMIQDTVIDGDEVVLDLSEYFSHVNGGDITYSVCLDDSGILEAAIDGNMLSVTGLTVGDAGISILATSGEDQMGDAFQVNVVAPTGGNGEPASCAFNYGTYSELTPMPIVSDAPASGLIGGKVYLAGGIDYGDYVHLSSPDFLQVYDTETDSWDTTGARIPVSRSFYGGGDMALDGKLYAIGGADWVLQGGEWYPVPYDRVDVYDPQSDTWELKANLPVSIGINGQCSLNGKIYVSGGISTDQTPLNTLYCYDPGTDQWTELSAMETARAAHTSVALDGKIYVFGGGAGDNFPNTVTMTCEVYDPELDQWASIAELPRTNAFGTASVIDGEIYLIGGSGVPTSDPYKYACKYNPESDAWIQIDDMETATKGHFVIPIGRTDYIFGLDIDDHPFTHAYTLSGIHLDSKCSDTVIDGDAVVMDLSEHFSHVDGGEITYSVCPDDSGILEATIEGSMLTITGLANGEGEISILAWSGEDQMGDAFKVNVITGIREVYSIPASLHIYPNPAKGTTTLAYTVRIPGVTRIEIYDMLGKRVAVPLNEHRTPGEYEFQLNTATFYPGIYFCRLHTTTGSATVKLMVEH